MFIHIVMGCRITVSYYIAMGYSHGYICECHVPLTLPSLICQGQIEPLQMQTASTLQSCLSRRWQNHSTDMAFSAFLRRYFLGVGAESAAEQQFWK